MYGQIIFFSGFSDSFLPCSKAIHVRMRKKNKNPVQAGDKKAEPEEQTPDENKETEKFIKRLEIQRKLLNEFVEKTAIIETEVSGTKRKLINQLTSKKKAK
jgi:hypothetical protein